jgi:hypothetical protein
VTLPQREGTALDPTVRRIVLAVLIVAIALVVAACVPGGGGGSGGPTPTATPVPPLHPASPGADPVSLFA